MSVCSLVLGVFLAAAPTPAHAPAAAWEWSDEQRLAERLNVSSIRERASREATEPYGVTPPRATSAAVVIGRRNPELFLPFELFGRFLAESFDDDPQRRVANRARISEAAGIGTLPDSFWTTLESATAPFLAQQHDQHALFTRLNSAATDADRAALRQQIAATQRDECRLRTAALTNATAALGRATLYRLLYRAIAPEMTMIASEPESAERLRQLEGGCR